MTFCEIDNSLQSLVDAEYCNRGGGLKVKSGAQGKGCALCPVKFFRMLGRNNTFGAKCSLGYKVHPVNRGVEGRLPPLPLPF